MYTFVTELKYRNETLFYFTAICFISAVLFLALTMLTTSQVGGVNAWFKPFKSALSIALYASTIAWYTFYLPSFNFPLFNWSVIILLGFEILYITIQASRGQQSHFNLSTPFYSMLYGLMAVAATAVSIYTAYIAFLFFIHRFPGLPLYYLWSIRIGLILFVIFSLEGFVMGARLSHTIGGTDGGQGLLVLNWSKKFGDPRIAHFVGMHALQVLPVLSWYIFRSTKATLIAGGLYGLLALLTLMQALAGKPYHRF